MSGTRPKIDLAALKRFQAGIKKLTAEATSEFTEEAVKELAARLLAKAMKRTPVGQYEKGSGMVGGTLRRGWTVGDVTKSGDVFSVEVYNPVEYAPYVEFGHRTVDGRGWVEGRFMMTISEAELQNEAAKIIERKLAKFLASKMGG